MCGLTGYFDLGSRAPADRETVAAMTAALTHRGPDSDGFFWDEGLAFGFRRLMIIDLETGDQPILNEDGSIVMMCNGEIYNYRALRDELVGRGHRFRTSSDVEVLVHLYEEHGTDFLDRLNGQFAFAIYDRPKRRLFMARDHFGIAPLHYARVGDTLIFGSEIKAILKHPAVRPEVDLTGLDQILSFPGTVSPRTMFAGISSLPAGHTLIADEGGVRTECYWDLDYPVEPDTRRREEEHLDALAEALTLAVRYRLQADVPVGFYLSGGLDSSLIGALATREAGRSLDSFSITFEDAEINEARHQRAMVDRLGSRHHERVFRATDIADRLATMVRHCECPVKETYNTCAMSLSAMAREAGVPVILAGQGADELFGGYPGYRVDRSGTRAVGDDLEAIMEDEARARMWGDPAIFYEKNQVAYAETKTALYAERLRERFYDFDATQHPLVDHARLAGRDVFHQRAYLDLKLRLQDHLLGEHGDRMVMMSSIEGRYPFLDIDVVELVRRMPADLKLHGFEEKYPVKQVARPHVPVEIIEREKFGFRAPGSPYLLQQGIDWVADLLSPARIRRQGYFDADVVERLRARYAQPGFRLNPHLETDLLLIVITFNLFLDQFGLPDLN